MFVNTDRQFMFDNTDVFRTPIFELQFMSVTMMSVEHKQLKDNSCL